ncbi:MAG: acetate--CoA ligase family protein, partial [Thermomicrobiales bacterium]
NLYSVRPVAAVTFDVPRLPIQEVPDKQTIRSFIRDLICELRGESSTRLPVLSQGESPPEGDPDNLGQALAIIIEELQKQAGWRLTESGSRSLDDGTFEVFCEIEDEKAGRAAAEVGVTILEDLINDRQRSLAQARMHQAELLDPEFPQNLGVTPRFKREARRRGIRVFERTDKRQFLEFGTGCYQKKARKAVTSESGQVSHQIARDKNRASLVLQEAGLPAPRNRRVRSAEAAVRAAERIGYPVVLKPLDGAQAMGVYPGIRDAAGVRECFAGAQSFSRHGDVVVEQFLEGDSYRVLVVDQEVIGALERRPAEVVGDGKHTVRQLVDIENASPARQPRPDNYLAEIDVNEQTLLALEWQRLHMESVPEAGRTVRLKLIPSGSNGGTRVDRLADMHPDNIEIARQAAKTVGLAVAGLDFVTPDITRSVWEVGGGIVEINGAPAFYPHYRITTGRAFDPVVRVMEMLYPPGAQSQVDAIAIAHALNPDAICRIVESLISEPGRTIGVAHSGGVSIEGARVGRFPGESPTPLQAVLRNPLIDTAILVPQPADFASPGLEIDILSVLVVGAGPNLEGGYGIKSPASVMATMTGASGSVVIDANALDLDEVTNATSAPVILVSAIGITPRVQDHLERGGSAMLARETNAGIMIELRRGDTGHSILDAREVAGWGSQADAVDLDSLLLGVGAVVGFGVALDSLRSGLLATTGATTHGMVN